MTYDLDAFESECASLGIACHRVASDQIDLMLAANCILQFSNQPSEGDSMVGFSDTLVSDRQYAAYHQLGTKRMPSRPFFPFKSDGRPTAKAKELVKTAVVRALSL